jgi:basic membrane protein A
MNAGPVSPRGRRGRGGWRAAAAAAAIAVALAAGCAPGAEAPGTPPGTMQVGLVYDVGGRGDKSFNDAAYAGLERARSELGVAVQDLETSEGGDREAQLRQLAARGAALVFGVGFLFSDDIRALAGEFPEVKFACVDYTLQEGDSLPPNLVALKFREEEGSFLVGALAGLLTKRGTVGFVGGMEIPLIRKFEAGFRAGVAAVNPRARVIVKYAGTTGAAFKDPTKGKELALAEIQQGADIIFHASGSTGLGVFEAAKESGALAIGVDSDQWDAAPGVVLTSMVKRVETAVFETVREVKEDRWRGGVHVFGLGEGGVDWVYDERNRHLIPDPVKAAVDSLRAEIVAGRIAVPSQ